MLTRLAISGLQLPDTYYRETVATVVVVHVDTARIEVQVPSPIGIVITCRPIVAVRAYIVMSRVVPVATCRKDSKINSIMSCSRLHKEFSNKKAMSVFTLPESI